MVHTQRFHHYGHNVQKLIAKAISMEDGTKKDGFVQVIGSYMKLAYRTWNKEHYVSDDTILDDLQSLSHGKLQMVEDASLDHLTRSNMKRSINSGGGGRQQQRGKSSQSNGRSSGRQQQRRRHKK